MARLYFLCARCVLWLLFAATSISPLVGETEPLLRPARLVEAQGAERRLLDRFERYLHREQWEDAFESAARLLQAKLLQDRRSTVVEVGKHRFVSTREYVHQRLAKLPARVLAEYRALVDAPAEAWTRQGIVERDSQPLQRVVDELFCSSWGDDALFALGELALEQGEHQTARRYWSRISSEFQLFAEPPVLAYPDTDFTLAQIGARLALVSLYEGDRERAKKEIQAISANHPKAMGRLGGQEVVFAEALTQMLQQAEGWQLRPPKSDWPTYAGSTARTRARPTAGKTAYKKLWSRPLGETSEAGLRTFPIVLGERLLYQNASQVVALRLDTGERVFAAEGVAFQSPAIKTPNSGRPCYTLSGTNHRVFGTTLVSLWGIDLRRDGALIFQQQPETAALVGAPVVVGERLWAALQTGGRAVRAGIACYDLVTQKKIWQQWVCRADMPTMGQSLASNLLTCDSGVIYSCTQLGAISATRAEDGHPLWVATYQRTNFHTGYRSPNPCLFHRGILFVLPTDSSELLAFDAATGIVRWQRKMASPEGQILGVAAGSLLVSDEGLRTFDLKTGEPQVHRKELRLQGSPVIVGETVYWPTEQTIKIIDTATGNPADETLQLPESGGANLLVADKYLVAAGPTQIIVYQSQTVRNESPQISQIP